MDHPCGWHGQSQGNILALLDKDGNTVVKYTYDAWGNHTVEDSTECGLNLYAYLILTKGLQANEKGFGWHIAFGFAADRLYSIESKIGRSNAQ